MSFLFGPKVKTRQEVCREQERNISRSVRELDRETARLEVEEKKLLRDMRAAAKRGDAAPVKTMGKELVRTRFQIARLAQLATHMKNVGMRIRSGKGSDAMMAAVRGATAVMKDMSGSMDAKGMAAVLAEFEKEHLALEAREDLISDVMDDAMGSGDAEAEEVADVVAKVFAEVGVDIGGEMAAVPTQPVAWAQGPGLGGVSVEAEIEERLRRLRD